jgi:hypothetical protein
MRSDAILKLFSEYSLSGAETNDHVALRFAEHLSLRYRDISSGELAFFLRVGGQLVRQKMEDRWNAIDTTVLQTESFDGTKKGICNIDRHDMLLGHVDGISPIAANDSRYDHSEQGRHAAGSVDATAPLSIGQLRLIPKAEPPSQWSAPSALSCIDIQAAEPDRLKHLFDSLKNEVARAKAIIASSRMLIDRSKDLRESLDLI